MNECCVFATIGHWSCFCNELIRLVRFKAFIELYHLYWSVGQLTSALYTKIVHPVEETSYPGIGSYM